MTHLISLAQHEPVATCALVLVLAREVFRWHRPMTHREIKAELNRGAN